MNHSLKWRFVPIWFGILLTFALVPVWYRFDGAPRPFTANYMTGFAIFASLVWTIGWWIVLGTPGLHTLWKDSRRSRWLLLFIAFIGWIMLSTTWAFMHETRPEVAIGVAVGWGLAGLFVLVVLCIAPSPRIIVLTLVCIMLVHGAIGGLQVAEQGSIGLQSLGEFELDPQESGISVIMSGDVRWLRPYGLTSHSNIFAGFMTVGVLATAGLILSDNRVIRWFGTLAFWFGLWILMLTFSRAAWLGFGVGTVVLLVLLIIQRIIPISRTDAIYRVPTDHLDSVGTAYMPSVVQKPHLLINLRHTILTLAGAVVLGIAFFILYRPLLLTRAGVGTVEYTESRSIELRDLFNQIAIDAIRTEPLHGVGIGNFPWYASDYLFYRTDTGMRGDNVHHIYLYAFSELGIVGFVLFVSLLTWGIAIGGRRGDLIGRPYKTDGASGYGGAFYRYALLAGVVALAVIGFFDHYPWSLLHYQALWWGLLAASMPYGILGSCTD